MDVSKLKKEKIKDAINSIITDYGFLNDEIDNEVDDEYEANIFGD